MTVKRIRILPRLYVTISGSCFRGDLRGRIQGARHKGKTTYSETKPFDIILEEWKKCPEIKNAYIYQQLIKGQIYKKYTFKQWKKLYQSKKTITNPKDIANIEKYLKSLKKWVKKKTNPSRRRLSTKDQKINELQELVHQQDEELNKKDSTLQKHEEKEEQYKTQKRRDDKKIWYYKKQSRDKTVCCLSL